MKANTIICGFILLAGSSCATLNISEIKHLEKTGFDTLSLTPSTEVNNLRIDIIRNIYLETVDDSTAATRKTAYHPLGFDLGNGLFYDLNENLCLRIDYLLGFSPEDNFTLDRINRPLKNKRMVTYRLIHDSLQLYYPRRDREFYQYHRIKHHDSTLYMYNKKLKYTITQSDTLMTYSRKRFTWNAIHKLDKNDYYVNKRKRNIRYQIRDYDILLKKDYIIHVTNNGSTIEIKRPRKSKDRVLLTIEKSGNTIFIYNKHYFGKKIEFDHNSLLIYMDNTLIEKYELEDPG